MRTTSRSAGILFLAVASVLGCGLPAWSAINEAEPNNSPQNPQDLGAVALPLTLTGSLDTPPDTPDIDYFRMSIAPQTRVRIDLEGASTGRGTLSDPYLSVQFSEWWWGTSDDDGGTGTNSVVRVTIPDSGVVVIGVTSFGDYMYDGRGGSSGSYGLTVAAIPAPSSVSGRAVDATTGEPLADVSAYASANLRRCDEKGCKETVGMWTLDGEGRFVFDMRSLDIGRYQVVIQAQGYRSYETDPFVLSDAENRDLGDLAVQPLPHIASITGRTIDAQTGQPLQAEVVLNQCGAADCNRFVSQLTAGADGRFRFDRDWGGLPLGVASYLIRASSNFYVQASTDRFPVFEGQSLDVGDIALQPLPRIGAIGGQVVDAFTGAPLAGASVELRQCADWGCYWVMNSQPSDAGGRFRFEKTAWGDPMPPASYQVWISANFYNARVTEPFAVADAEQRDLGVIALDAWPHVESISGRIVDSETGQPLSALVRLVRWCDYWGECGDVASQISAPDGGFRFERNDWGGILEIGRYKVVASVDRYDPGGTEPFDAVDRENRDVGDVPLVRIRIIGSVSGRIVDSISRQPLSGASDPWTWVTLQRYDESGNCEWFGAQYADADGRYRFSPDGWGPMRVGNYRVDVWASQYNTGLSEPLEVTEGEDRDFGDFGLKPYPVQFFEVSPCGTLPSAGGTCEYRVVVRAGNDTRLKGEAWSLVNIWWGTGSFLGSTNFQAGTNDARVPVFEKVKLDPGQRGALRFKFEVPASVPADTWICATAWVGEEPAPTFQTLGNVPLFCVSKEPSGFTLVPDRKVKEAYRQLKSVVPSK